VKIGDPIGSLCIKAAPVHVKDGLQDAESAPDLSAERHGRVNFYASATSTRRKSV
jgi:hypothetical protein